jgi:hypothetical protein
MLGQDGAVAAGVIGLKAEQRHGVASSLGLQPLELNPGCRFLQMVLEQIAHLSDPAFARRVAPGLGRSEITQMQIVDAVGLQAFAEDRLGKAGPREAATARTSTSRSTPAALSRAMTSAWVAPS